MEWYAVRSVYHFGTKNDGKNIFEERIVCFKASNFEQANEKGAKESKQYSDDNRFDVYPEQLTYKQDGDTLIDGYEVWSELYESYYSLEQFYMERYTNYVYNENID